MPPAPPPFLPTSALALELDAYVVVTAAMHAGFADARVNFECSFPRFPADDGGFEHETGTRHIRQS